MVVEAKVLWGTDVLSIAYFAPKSCVRLRDLPLPLPPHDEDVVVARVTKGRFAIDVSERSERVVTIVVPELRLGLCTLQIALVDREAVPAVRMPSDGRVVRGVALAFALHAAFLALAFASRASAAESEARALEQLKVYSTAAEERPKADLLLPKNPSKADETSASSGAAKKEAGVAGNPARVDDGGRRRKTLGDNREKIVPGEEKTFGMIALLQGHHAGNSAFTEELGHGAMGNIFGETIDDAAGAAGLGLSGDGEGGGGLGAAVPLERIGTGTGFGFGNCHCRLGGTHTPRPPVIVEGFATVSGRLPPEAIQRIVRQNFGRFRACYQNGLERNPSIEGRITVKFVIGREGEVTAAGVVEDLVDPSVANCVAHRFESMSFPKPTGGSVYVTYPIVFEKT